MAKEKKPKQKKPKVTYIDDGRTIADMSGTRGGLFSSSKKKERTKPTISSQQTPFQTYWNAVRMMFVPMLVAVGCIGLIYLIVMIIFRLL